MKGASGAPEKNSHPHKVLFRGGVRTRRRGRSLRLRRKVSAVGTVPAIEFSRGLRDCDVGPGLISAWVLSGPSGRIINRRMTRAFSAALAQRRVIFECHVPAPPDLLLSGGARGGGHENELDVDR